MKSETYLSPATWVLLLSPEKELLAVSGQVHTDKFIIEEDETDDLF